MALDPVTLAIISEGINLGVEAIGGMKKRKLQEKQSKNRRKAIDEELLNDSLDRSLANEERRLRSSRRLGHRKAEALRSTAASLRGALT